MILYPVFQYLKENEDITKQFKTQSEDHEDEMNGKHLLVDISDNVNQVFELCALATESVPDDDIYSSIFSSLYSIFTLPKNYHGKEMVYDYLKQLYNTLSESKNCTSSVLYYYAQMLYMNREFDASFDLVSSSLSQYANNYKLVELYFNILIYHPPQTKSFTTESINDEFKQYSTTIDKKDLGLLYVKWIKYLISIHYESLFIQKLFKKAIRELTANQDVLLYMFMTYLHQSQQFEGLEVFYQYIHDSNTLIHMSADLYSSLLKLYEKYAEDQQHSVLAHKRILSLYDDVTTLFGKTNIDVWIHYLRYIRSKNDITLQNRIYSRAIHNVNDINLFNEKYNLLINHI